MIDLNRAQSIARIVNYMKDDERNSFEESEDNTVPHIYTDVLILRGIVLDYCELVRAEGPYTGRTPNSFVMDEEIKELRELVG